MSILKDHYLFHLHLIFPTYVCSFPSFSSAWSPLPHHTLSCCLILQCHAHANLPIFSVYICRFVLFLFLILFSCLLVPFLAPCSCYTCTRYLIPFSPFFWTMLFSWRSSFHQAAFDGSYHLWCH